MIPAISEASPRSSAASNSISGIGRHRQNGSFAEQTETVLIGERDGSEMAAVDTRDPVMPRELFVEKRLVRGQQIEDAAIPFQLGIEEQLHFPDERDPQVVVEPGKLLVAIRGEQPDVSRLQPFLEEVLHRRGACTSVIQHALDLSIEYSRLVQLFTGCCVEQFVIGNAAPEEKRQARRQLDIRQDVRGAGGGASRIG